MAKYFECIMEEINLKELVKYIVSKLHIASLIFAAIVSLGAIYTSYVKTPLYSSSTKLVLTLEPGNVNQVSSSDVALFNNLVKTYADIVKSNAVMERVIDSLGLKMSAQALANKVTVTTGTNTHIIDVSVSDTDSERAREIADQIGTEFTKEIESIYRLKNVKVVDKALASGVPYNIDMKKSMVRYAAAGAAVGLTVVIAMFYLDNTVKSSRIVEERTGLTVLGVVPDMDEKKKEKKK